VRSFRNLADAELELPPRGLVLVGPNGHGKTSLLEALLYLEVFRSFRGARDRELVRFGHDGFRVEVEIAAGAARGGADAGRPAARGSAAESAPGAVVTAGYDARTAEKRVTLGGAAVGRLADAIGMVRGVVLSPSDVQLATGGARVRRGFMDVLLSLVVPGYVAALAEYRRALRHRCRAGSGDIEDWEALLARSGARVTAARRAWTERWAARYREHCGAVGEVRETALCYAVRGEGTDDERGLAAALERSRERDLARGTTSVGPHRDDLRLLLEGREVGVFGSAGQRRTAALALRLLEAETLGAADGRRGGEPPMICLDDAFAELDAERRERLGALIEALASRGSQVFATVPRDGELPEDLRALERWRVRDGTIGREAA
jgi:DNA replication and repair protein RecF